MKLHSSKWKQCRKKYCDTSKRQKKKTTRKLEITWPQFPFLFACNGNVVFSDDGFALVVHVMPFWNVNFCSIKTAIKNLTSWARCFFFPSSVLEVVILFFSVRKKSGRMMGEELSKSRRASNIQVQNVITMLPHKWPVNYTPNYSVNIFFLVDDDWKQKIYKLFRFFFFTSNWSLCSSHFHYHDNHTELSVDQLWIEIVKIRLYDNDLLRILRIYIVHRCAWYRNNRCEAVDTIGNSIQLLSILICFLFLFFFHLHETRSNIMFTWKEK